ncbi:MAG: AAA family ATPase [Alphaproteobacteria bacterium]
MNLGDILVAKGLVTTEQINQALAHQQENGGRLGDSLVALEIVTKEQIDGVIGEAPRAPLGLDDCGIDSMFLLNLMLKGMYTENMELGSQLADAMKVSGGMVNRLIDEAKERKLLEATGSAGGGASVVAEMRHQLTRLGREWAAEAMLQSQYFGPAPVSLEAYQDRIQMQRITNEWVSRPMLDDAFNEIVVPDTFVRRLGPAVNSGTAILIYGPAGNGKTTIAEIVGHIFQNVVYVPYCVEIDGDIMKVYDPTIHKAVAGSAGAEETGRGARRSKIDPRWVACYRPMVITGGELTIEMLDLKFNPMAKFYEAPLHIKALNGTFLIDDFGRQRVKPEDILNRWIVPLNSRVDYLTLHSGKTIQLPFDEIVIFSTNLHPNDLMDPAFQRRIAYKLETLEPDEALFRQVFDNMARARGLELTDDVYNQVVAAVRENEAPLAYFQPKFVIDQVLASCKFEGVKPQFTYEFVEDAMTNLFVQASEAQMFGVARS